MRIQLSDERRKAILDALTELFTEDFDLELSPFRAERVLDMFVRTLGPSVYNQAIQDARRYVSNKLEDLDAEHYVPEDVQ